MAGPLSQRYRTALVTGATSGLGAAFVAMLRAEGVEVWGTSRRRDRVPDGEGFHGLDLDLAEETSILAAWVRAEEQAGGIDLLVNNAGEGIFAPLAELRPAEFARQVDVLFSGPVRLASEALAAMGARGRGCIVNITSLAAEFPVPCLVTYSAAKAALAAWTAGLVLERAGAGVRVLDFRPGDYRTRFNDGMHRPRDGGWPAQVWRRLEAITRAAPEPARAARDLRAALVDGREGVVRSGTFFQARLAPLLQRFAAQGLSRAVQRAYFRIR